MGREIIKGSTNVRQPQANETESPYPAWDRKPTQEPFSWGNSDPALFQRAVDAVNARGDSISFARGRAGNWVSVTILAGSERPKYTAYSPEQADALLEELASVRAPS